MTEISRSRHSESGDPHWVEWVAGIISAVLVIGMIAWVGYEAWVQENQPPSFRVEITGKGPVTDGYRIEFDIANLAARTAATVTVRGEIRDGGQKVENADVVIDYVPAQSKSSGALIFSDDPGARELRIRAVGYSDP
jgi:uncharacterized protein (TIGR02588 family)